MQERVIEKPTTAKASKADKAYEELFRRLEVINPDLADLVRKKHDTEAADFAKAANSAMPSKEASYWAKKGCRKCYGRGIIGHKYHFRPGEPARAVKDPETGKKEIVNGFKHEVRCTCTVKKYQLWLAEFRLFYNALKAQMAAQESEGSEE